MTGPRDRALIAICAVPTLVQIAMLLWYPRPDLTVLWPRGPVSAGHIALMAASTAAYVAGALLVLRSGPAVRARWPLLIAVGCGGLVQFATVAVYAPDPLLELLRRTYAWKTGGYWTVGAPVTDVLDFIGQYAERAPLYPVHQSRHPPGLSLIFWLGTRLFEFAPGLSQWLADLAGPAVCQSLLPVDSPAPVVASGVFGVVVELVLAFAPMWPLAVLVQKLADRRAAVLAVLLYGLAPGMGEWVSQFDRGLALATGLTLLQCERWAQTRALRAAVGAGLVMSVATFVSFGAVPIALIAAAYLLVRVPQVEQLRSGRQALGWLRTHARTLFAAAAAGVAGALSVWALAWLVTGLNPLHLYDVVFDSHLGIDFPFWPFVVWHPWDLITMAGIPAALLTLAAGWRRAPALSVAFAAPIALLALAHVARGETGRVWLYFLPVVIGAAAISLRHARMPALAAVFLLTGVQTTVQGLLLRMHEKGFWPETLPMTASLPPDATRVDTRFGPNGQIALLGYRITPLKRGAEGAITLYWQRMSERPLQTAFKAFVHVAVDDSDQIRVAQHDEMPVYELYPTTCWQPGQIVADTHPLKIEPNARAGPYPVFVGLYDPISQSRPPTFASPPARQMHGSVLLPDPARVE